MLCNTCGHLSGHLSMTEKQDCTERKQTDRAPIVYALRAIGAGYRIKYAQRAESFASAICHTKPLRLLKLCINRSVCVLASVSFNRIGIDKASRLRRFWCELLSPVNVGR